MSNIETQVCSLLKEVFPPSPFKRVFEQHYVLYKRQKLFFDFYIKELFCFIETQGLQHTQFVKHFHGDKEGFLNQKKRDNLKIEYVQENELYLVRLYDNEDISKELIYTKINKALDSEYNFCD